MTTVAIGDVADIVMGQAPPGTACNKTGDGVPFVKAGEFTDRRPLIREWTTKPVKLAEHDDVLVCVVGATAGKVNQGADCAIGRSVAAVRPRSGLVDSDYLYRFLFGQVDRLRAASQGLAQGVITRDMLTALKLPLPPLESQRRIAAILDRSDALRAKRRQVLVHLDSLAQSLFHSMFSADFPEVALGEQLEFLTSGSRGWAKYYTPTGDKFLRIQNVRRDELALDDLAFVAAPRTAEAKRTLVKPGDVLMSITADLGRTAVVPEDIGTAYINQHLSILRAPSIQPRYLSAFITSPEGQHRIAGRNRAAVKAGLNFDDVRSLRIPLPPRSLQDEFAARASAVDATRSRVRGALNADDRLFASLQSRAFRGEL